MRLIAHPEFSWIPKRLPNDSRFSGGGAQRSRPLETLVGRRRRPPQPPPTFTHLFSSQARRPTTCHIHRCYSTTAGKRQPPEHPPTVHHHSRQNHGRQINFPYPPPCHADQSHASRHARWESPLAFLVPCWGNHAQRQRQHYATASRAAAGRQGALTEASTANRRPRRRHPFAGQATSGKTHVRRPPKTTHSVNVRKSTSAYLRPTAKLSGAAQS